MTGSACPGSPVRPLPVPRRAVFEVSQEGAGRRAAGAATRAPPTRRSPGRTAVPVLPRERPKQRLGVPTRLLPPVWLAFTVSARTREELRPYAERLYDQTRELVHKVLAAAERTGVLRDGIDVDIETERLYALVDGLALHSVLQPGRLDAESLRAALRRHLDEIMPRAAGR
ncbi:TetR family transcriptional regulator C-terminal domain-containing protein [Actinoallomurus soli]|uniref:TetR family transcriptional regulator C-terminal domain-containing protein n=1 Tax=Actinoallomurus soli TaxID=2952535 RepID=UPI00209367A6|nr:TetR family transcriptional regulator C-terminal domain-containing protein [Actinoallomurus soli]MCO5974499.1 TetR family transcriptional regulator C-terminal domain-containing protein [Actinoallomurus soli]